MAVVLLEAEDPEWALELAPRELAASEAPFYSWYGAQMRRLFGCDLARSPPVAGDGLLFARREAPDEGEQEPPEGW